MRSVSAPVQAALLMLIANLCVAGMTCTIRKLPCSAALASLLFAEVPSIRTWCGGATIFAATIYIAQREARIARTRAALAPASASEALAPPTRSRS